MLPTTPEGIASNNSDVSTLSAGRGWEVSPRDMREGDAMQIAERLGSYNRTSSSEVPRFTRIGRNSEDNLPKPAKQASFCCGSHRCCGSQTAAECHLF